VTRLFFDDSVPPLLRPNMGGREGKAQSKEKSTKINNVCD
jgi:hypothetical protein